MKFIDPLSHVVDHGTHSIVPERPVYVILSTISFCHFLNDLMQALMLAMYPLLKSSLSLSFTQIGFLTIVFQCTASLLQPPIGFWTDRHPQPFSTVIGMGFSFFGLLGIAFAPTYHMLLLAAGLVGIGSSVFHPESSRIARIASGRSRGLGQSLFQFGGNFGQAIGPLCVALFVAPFGRISLAKFAFVPIFGLLLLIFVGRWCMTINIPSRSLVGRDSQVSKKTIVCGMAILVVLLFSKSFYTASITSFFTFYLIDRFSITVDVAQYYLFIFLFSAAAGTFFGGPIGDKYGKEKVIWLSILGAAPFSLLLPYVNLIWTGVLIACTGFIISSAFSVMMVYAQELIPGRIGLVSGIFFGFSFGLGGIGAAVLGKLADSTNIQTVYHVCSFLPLIGIFAFFLPSINIDTKKNKV